MPSSGGEELLLTVDDRAWTANAGQVAGLVNSTDWDSADPAPLQAKADLLAGVVGEMAADLVAAMASRPLDHDLRLRAWALLEALSAPQLGLLRRLGVGDPAQSAAVDAAGTAMNLADALRILLDGLPDEPQVGATNFDDAMENLLRIAARDLSACLPLLASGGPQRTAIMTSAFEGRLPEAKLPGAGGDGAAVLGAMAARLRACSRDLLARVSAATFAGVGSQLATAIDRFTAPIPTDAAPSAVWPVLYRLLDDASLHAVAASRRHEAADLLRALHTFERARRWIIPFATVERFAATSDADTSTPAAVCWMAAGHLLWATRDHMASRQLSWLPRVHEPALV